MERWAVLPRPSDTMRAMQRSWRLSSSSTTTVVPVVGTARSDSPRSIAARTPPLDCHASVRLSPGPACMGSAVKLSMRGACGVGHGLGVAVWGGGVSTGEGVEVVVGDGGWTVASVVGVDVVGADVVGVRVGGSGLGVAASVGTGVAVGSGTGVGLISIICVAHEARASRTSIDCAKRSLQRGPALGRPHPDRLLASGFIRCIGSALSFDALRPSQEPVKILMIGRLLNLPHWTRWTIPGWALFRGLSEARGRRPGPTSRARAAARAPG